MKKIIVTVLAIVAVFCLSAFAFTACGETEKGVYDIFAPDGAPVLALADMWGEDTENAELNYGVIGESEVNTKMKSGEADFIAAPINIGASIHAAYKSGGTPYDYKLLNVTSWGVIYFTTNEDRYKTREECASAAEFLSQFDGKTMSTIGLAAIPGKTVQYLFGEAEASVTLNGSDATVIQQSYVKGDATTAIFAEPAITGVRTKAGEDSVKVLASVSDIYKEITGKDFPMSGLFVRSDVLENDPDAVKAVDERVKSSVEKFNSNIDEVSAKAESIEGFSLKAAVIKKAYDKMNVAYKNSDGSKGDVETLLTKIGAPCDDDLFA